MNYAARKKRGLVKARGKGRPYKYTVPTGVPSVTFTRDC